MWNQPKQEELDRIPRLYQTEHIALPDKTIYLHFFIGDCDWYISEWNGEDLFFGFACLNGDLFNAEWGFISYEDLKSIHVNNIFQVEYDLYWSPKPASEVPLICRAKGWS